MNQVTSVVTTATRKLWVRVTVLLAIAAAALIAAFPEQAFYWLGFYGPALLLGGAVGWLVFDKWAWLAATVVFVAGTAVIHIQILG